MFVRPSARGSLSLPRVTSFRRPQLTCQARGPFLRPTSSPRLIVTRPDLLSRRKDARAGHNALQERSLATAVDDVSTQDGSFDVPPYLTPPSSRQPAPYDLRPFDPSKPLIVRGYAADPLPRMRATSNGIPGELESILSVFDACLHVNHLDRAAQVLQRLSVLKWLPPSDMTNLHNRYLRAGIEACQSQFDPAAIESMLSWYETEIRAAQLPHTPETVACTLKLALMLRSKKPDLRRRVNRYMGVLPGDPGLEALCFSDILTMEDVNLVSEVCTTHDISPDAWIFEDEDPSTTTPELAPEFASETTPDATSDTIKSVPQKGLGLKTLKNILSFFDDIEGRDLSQLSLAEQREFQARLERDSVDAAVSRWKEEHDTLTKMGKNTMVSTTALNSQLYEWQIALEARIKKDLDRLHEAQEQEDRTPSESYSITTVQFLKQSTPARLAAVTILSVLNSTAQAGQESGPLIAPVVQSLSKAIEEDVAVQRRYGSTKAAKSRRRMLRSAASTPSPSPTPTPTPTPEPSHTANENVVDPPQVEDIAWPAVIRAKIGAFLLSTLIDTTKIMVVREHPETRKLDSQLQPAFARTTMFKRGKKIGMVIPNKYLLELMKREPRGDLLARHLPMLVQPEPWTKFDKGGFIEFPSSLIRIKNAEKDQRVYADAALGRGDLEQVCNGLDVLGRTAWKINRPVLDVMVKAWNTGEAIANFPPLDPDFPHPPEPESAEDPMARRAWLQAIKQIENEKSGLHSERCFMNFQLEIANAFKEQTFYFPHNMDFRGRAYPIPTYLNHMGADHARGVLLFAKGKELGERGLRWLKVHLANVYGFDKASITEREEFAMKNLDNIIDSATNPLDGRRWWLEAEDQWQCLATCYELKAAMELPDPTKHVSHLPVHQDGTCNGLQHYAALGGDLWGAQQVNLEPGDRPADVYSAVANLVKEGIVKDMELENPLAKVMNGKITRKVVKQTVMTNVYGVTFHGARAQVQKQIEAAHPHIQAETGYQPILLASYVATKIFEALGTMFRGAHDIQYWLAECAGRVCRALTPEQLDKIVAAYGEETMLAEAEEESEEAKLLAEAIEMAGAKVLAAKEMAAKAQEMAAKAREMAAKQQGVEEGEVTKGRGRPRKQKTAAEIKEIAEKKVVTAFKKVDVAERKAAAVAAAAAAAAAATAAAEQKADSLKKTGPMRKANGGKKVSRLSMTELLTHFRSTIVWTTPLRLPVVQPYRKSGVRIIPTALQDLTITIPERSDPVNRRKQLQAFPPNFIHSLDASHMLLSAIECDALGLGFAAVHDSFWTHAADIDTMNRVLRDSFIRIHAEDVIARLASEFEARYKGSLYFAKVDANSAAGKAIAEHRAQNKLTLAAEILQERQRQQLLRSSDPAEVELGKAMTTPASILEAQSTNPISIVAEDMDEEGLESAASSPDEVVDEDQCLLLTKKPVLNSTLTTNPDELKDFLSVTGFQAALEKKPNAPRSTKAPIGVWLPLTLPELPKKGEFDVSRLKGSQYFFS